MQNLSTSCFYAQKNFKKARHGGSCGSGILKRLLLAIGRKSRKERNASRPHFWPAQYIDDFILNAVSNIL